MASSNAHNFGLNSTTAEEIASAFSSQIRGKTVLTTGVSPDGLGAYFVQAIAKHQPKLLVLATRDLSKANATAQAIAACAPGVQTRVLHLDLASQAQVRKAAAEVNAYEEPIDVLVNNAAVFSSERGKKTDDGLELLFGTNHIGHFLFTNLIMGRILAAGPEARIVNVASGGYRFSPIRFDDVDFSKEKDYNIWKAYGQSKTASMLFSISLADKLASKGVSSFSVHPGVIATNLGRTAAGEESLSSLKALYVELGYPQLIVEQIRFKTLSQGAATHIAAAFDPSIADQNGAYLTDCKVVPSNLIMAHAVDRGVAERLWKLSEKLVGENFSYFWI